MKKISRPARMFKSAGAAVAAGMLTTTMACGTRDARAITTGPEFVPPTVDEMRGTAFAGFIGHITLDGMVSVLEDWCVATQEPTDKIVVTLNPGASTAISRGRTVNQIIVSETEPAINGNPLPSVRLVPGPYEYINSLGESSGTLVEEKVIVTLPSDMAPDIELTRLPISPAPKVGNDGYLSYTVTATPQPLIKTVVTEGPFTYARVAEVCEKINVPS